VTSRRSMRSHQQRASRAFQFVPGHVGGRVASAQPVLRLGNISAQVDPEDVVVCGTDWPLTSGTSTTARYDGATFFDYTILSVEIAYTCTYTGTVTPEVRVYENPGVLEDPPEDTGAWSSWVQISDFSENPTTITGPGSGTESAKFGGGDPITAIEVKWDVANAFSSICVTPYNST